MKIGRVGYCLAIAGIYVAVRFAALATVPTWLSPQLAAVVYMAVLMLAQIAFVVSIPRTQMPARNAMIFIVPTALIVFGLSILERHLLGFSPVPVMQFLAVSAFRDLCLILFAGFLGYSISFIVREPNILLPAAVFAAFVDYWSVTWGPLSRIMETTPAVVETMSVSMPTPVPGLPGTMIGMGDFMFLALFFGILYRFAMNVRGAFWLGYALLTLSMVIVLRYGSALPALVPMSLAIVGANIKQFRLKREELLATLYVGLLLLVLLVASGIYMLRH